MSDKFVERILKSPFPREVAESLWNDLQRYGNKPGLERRLKDMTRAGITSEVIDLVEALEMDPKDALPPLITAYENASESTLSLARFHRKEGRHDLVIEETQDAEKSRLHANKRRNGEITVEQEIEARIEQRQKNGSPNNFYIDLLKNPLFPK